MLLILLSLLLYPLLSYGTQIPSSSIPNEGHLGTINFYKNSLVVKFNEDFEAYKKAINDSLSNSENQNHLEKMRQSSLTFQSQAINSSEFFTFSNLVKAIKILYLIKGPVDLKFVHWWKSKIHAMIISNKRLCRDQDLGVIFRAFKNLKELIDSPSDPLFRSWKNLAFTRFHQVSFYDLISILSAVKVIENNFHTRPDMSIHHSILCEIGQRSLSITAKDLVFACPMLHTALEQNSLLAIKFDELCVQKINEFSTQEIGLIIPSLLMSVPVNCHFFRTWLNNDRAIEDCFGHFTTNTILLIIDHLKINDINHPKLTQLIIDFFNSSISPDSDLKTNQSLDLKTKLTILSLFLEIDYNNNINTDFLVNWLRLDFIYLESDHSDDLTLLMGDLFVSKTFPTIREKWYLKFKKKYGKNFYLFLLNIINQTDINNKSLVIFVQQIRQCIFEHSHDFTYNELSELITTLIDKEQYSDELLEVFK